MAVGPFHQAAFALQELITLANEIERELARLLGLNLTDYRALSALAAAGPVTIGTLAERLGTTPATTTAIVNRLETGGHVQRERNAEDRRQVGVRATTSGLGRIMGLMAPLMIATNDYIQSLPADEQRVVADFLAAALGQMRDQLAAMSALESS